MPDSDGPHQAKVTVSGDDVPSDESALVISNHLSYSDFYLIHALASRKGMLGRCRYFAKKELKYIPILGWTLILVDMIMVSRNWMRDKVELSRVFSAVVDLKLPIWLITYVEGTRFTPQKCLESRKFCESRDKTELSHVLYPRHRGFYATLTQFRNTHVKYVYDLTLVYRNIQHGHLQHPPTPVETHSYGDISKHYDFHLHVRRFPIDEIPEEEDAVTSWLENRWIEKDQILSQMDSHWTQAQLLGNVRKLTGSI